MTVKKIFICNFCKKAQGEVRKIIAGPDDVAICDECVLACVKIINSEFAK